MGAVSHAPLLTLEPYTIVEYRTQYILEEGRARRTWHHHEKRDVANHTDRLHLQGKRLRVRFAVVAHSEVRKA